MTYVIIIKYSKVTSYADNNRQWKFQVFTDRSSSCRVIGKSFYNVITWHKTIEIYNKNLKFNKT